MKKYIFALIVICSSICFNLNANTEENNTSKSIKKFIVHPGKAVWFTYDNKRFYKEEIGSPVTFTTESGDTYISTDNCRSWQKVKTNQMNVQIPFLENDLVVYPNPIVRYFILQYNAIEKYSTTEMFIVDIAGHKKSIWRGELSKGLNEIRIDIGYLTNGNYTLVLEAKEQLIGKTNLMVFK